MIVVTGWPSKIKDIRLNDLRRKPGVKHGLLIDKRRQAFKKTADVELEHLNYNINVNHSLICWHATGKNDVAIEDFTSAVFSSNAMFMPYFIRIYGIIISVR